MMHGKRQRLIPWQYKAGFALVMFIPVLVLSVFMPWIFKKVLIEEARTDLVRIAEEIKDLARNRFDLVNIYQFQDENYVQRRLKEMVEIFVAFSRQLELETARKLFPREVAMKLMLQTISNVKFGELGYGFVLSRSGEILYHPQLPEGLDVSMYPYVQEILGMREGVIRYWWKHPGEAEESERIVAFQPVEFWDWVLCIGARISEVKDFSFETQQYEGFYDYIKSKRLRWRGYAMILSGANEVIAHPEIKRGNINMVEGAQVILETRQGYCSYTDTLNRTWLAGTAYFEPRNWVIAVTALEEEVLAPNRRIRLEFWGLALVCVFLEYFVFINPLKRLVLRVHTQARKKITGL